MLTGGIDLSVGSVASMSGFLVASLVGDYGLWPSVAVALLDRHLGRPDHRAWASACSASTR